MVKISNNNANNGKISNFNEQFNGYKEKILYGADVLSIINKAIDNNQTNNIQKNDEGYYRKRRKLTKSRYNTPQ